MRPYRNGSCLLINPPFLEAEPDRSCLLGLEGRARYHGHGLGYGYRGFITPANHSFELIRKSRALLQDFALPRQGVFMMSGKSVSDRRLLGLRSVQLTDLPRLSEFYVSS